MTTLSRTQWNMVLLGALLLGSLFISSTRALPPQSTSAPAPAQTTLDPAPLPDHPAPDFALTALDGSTIRLSDLSGKVALINIWATWCPPCRAEMPAIQATYDAYRNEGFTVVAINVEEQPETVAAFMREYGLTFTAALDGDGQVSRTYQANTLPSSFFIDRRGVIRAAYRGPMSWSVLMGTTVQLLQEKP